MPRSKSLPSVSYSGDLKMISDIFDRAWAAFADGQRVAVGDVNTERNRMAQIIFELFSARELVEDEIAGAAVQMMRDKTILGGSDNSRANLTSELCDRRTRRSVAARLRTSALKKSGAPSTEGAPHKW